MPPTQPEKTVDATTAPVIEHQNDSQAASIAQSIGKELGKAFKEATGEAGLLKRSVEPFTANTTMTKQNHDVRKAAQEYAEKLGHAMPVDPMTGKVEWRLADPAVPEFWVTTCPACGSTIQARWHSGSLNDKSEIKAPFPMLAIIAPGGVQFGRFCPKRKIAAPISTTGATE